MTEVRRLTGLDPHNAAILIGIETDRGPFGDTEPPVRWEPGLWERLNRLTAKRERADPCSAPDRE